MLSRLRVCRLSPHCVLVQADPCTTTHVGTSSLPSYILVLTAPISHLPPHPTPLPHCRMRAYRETCTVCGLSLLPLWRLAARMRDLPTICRNVGTFPRACTRVSNETAECKKEYVAHCKPFYVLCVLVGDREIETHKPSDCSKCVKVFLFHVILLLLHPLYDQRMQGVENSRQLGNRRRSNTVFDLHFPTFAVSEVPGVPV